MRNPLDRRRFVAAASGAVAVTITASALSRAARASARLLPRTAAGVSLPDTPIARAAADLGQGAMPPFLFNHCVRTYVFGAMLSRRDGVDFDHEIMFVAAALHDLGLVASHSSKDQAFEMDSADEAKRLLEAHGVRGSRAELVWNAVAMHASSLLSHQPRSAQLVGLGAAADVTGYRVATLPKDQVASVLAAYPRLGFKKGFEGLLVDYCNRKPLAQVGAWTDDFCRRHNHDAQFPRLEQHIDSSPFAE